MLSSSPSLFNSLLGIFSPGNKKNMKDKHTLFTSIHFNLDVSPKNVCKYKDGNFRFILGIYTTFFYKIYLLKSLLEQKHFYNFLSWHSSFSILSLSTSSTSGPDVVYKKSECTQNWFFLLLLHFRFQLKKSGAFNGCRVGLFLDTSLEKHFYCCYHLS